MDEEGNCIICFKKCVWLDFKIVIKINEEVLQKMFIYEYCIEKMFCDVEELYVKIVLLVNEMNKCKLKLQEIVLSLDNLLIVEYIDLMIYFEEIEK